jgi:hypothetical protein
LTDCREHFSGQTNGRYWRKHMSTEETDITVQTTQTVAGRDVNIKEGGVRFEGEMSGGTIVGRDQHITYGLTVEEVNLLFGEWKNADQPNVWNGRIPYIGLSAFQESDAQFFFGRESLVDDLLARVQKASFIVIAGPSGSGKSSVARAGLFHALRSNCLEKSDAWLRATMQPGGDPIEQLAAAVERAGKIPGTGNHIRQQGLDNPLALTEQIQPLLNADPRQRFVLLVDQFEEAFTQTKDEAARAAFIHLLTTAAQTENGRTIVILSLRSDFISHCARYPDLRELMSQQFQLVGAMEPHDLAKAITLPALEVGAEIDPALVSRIMADMKGEPGALPLMSFALRDLFEAEKTKKGEPMDLTLPEYLHRGGIEKALERHANQVFAHFSAEQQALAKTIFSRLIEVGQGRVDTRRTAVFSELIPAGQNAAAVSQVIDSLAREGARLLTTSGGHDQETDTPTAATVTIAHEKLIDAWPWLRQLVDENREAIALQNQIAADAQAWAEEKDAGYLNRGGRLAQVEEKLAKLAPSLNELSQQFVQASLAERQREIDEKEARERQKLEQERALAQAQRHRAEEAEQAAVKQSRLTRIAFAVGSVALILAIVAGIAGVWAAYSAAQAEQARGTAVAESTRAAENLIVAEQERERADEHAAEAIAESTRAAESLAIAEQERERADKETDDAIAQALIAQSQGLASSSLAVQAQDPMRGLLLAIAAGETSETPLAYDALREAIPRNSRLRQTLAHEGWVGGAAWSGDESAILTWSDDGTARLWDTASGAELLRLTHESSVLGVAWNGDESAILTRSSDGTARLWDAASGAELLRLTHEGGVIGAAWNGNESAILTWSFSDGTARVWDAASGAERWRLTHDGAVYGAAWNGDESAILTWSHDGTARLWDVASSAERLYLPHEDWVYGAVWNGDESAILTWSKDSTARLWDAASGAVLFRLTGGGSPVVTAQWSQDERHILFITENGLVGRSLTRMADLLDVACEQYATRNFTWQEWQLYFPGQAYRITCPQWPAHPSVPAEALSEQ